jgi:uncharacterized membrane protein
MPKLALVRLASSHILQLIGMTAWGVGAIPLNVQVHMQYLLYCVICFRVRSTTMEVFVADVMDATLANCKVFT